MLPATSLSIGRRATTVVARRTMFVIHRWLGLTAGVIFAIAAGSGAVLVYADELDALLAGPRFHTTPGLVDAATVGEIVRREAPGARIVRVIWPADDTNVLNVRVVDRGRSRDLVLDAGTGAVLKPRAPHWLLATIRRLHTGLLMGTAGTYVVQLASWAALVSLALGVLLWWPGWRRFAHGFRVRLRRGSYAASLDLHRTLGILAAPLLLVMTATGVLMNATVLHGISRMVDGADASRAWAALRSDPARSTPELDLPGAVRFARAAEAGTAVTYLVFAADDEGVIEAGLVGTTGESPGRRLRVALDRYSGAVLLRQQVGFDARSNSRLHFGAAFGPVVRALYAASCVVGFTLLPTGAAAWWLRRRGRPLNARRAA